MDHALLNLSLTEAAEAIQQRQVSSRELTETLLAWSDEVQPKLNCFISLERPEVLEAARRADQLSAAGEKLGPDAPRWI